MLLDFTRLLPESGPSPLDNVGECKVLDDCRVRGRVGEQVDGVEMMAGWSE